MKNFLFRLALRYFCRGLTSDYSWFISYQANIAMAFVDNTRWYLEHFEKKRYPNKSDIFRIANRSADYFLEQLTGVDIEQMKWYKNGDGVTTNFKPL